MTDVVLARFDAIPQPEAILIEWASSHESNFSVFHLFRSTNPSDHYEQMTVEPIASSSSYQFLDTRVTPGVTYYYRLEALDRTGSRQLFGPVSARIEPRDRRSSLGLSFPNPAKGDATIPFTLGKAASVRVRILDLSGRQVRLLVDEAMEGGSRLVTWDGRDDWGNLVPAGIYLYQLQMPGFEASRRLVRLQ